MPTVGRESRLLDTSLRSLQQKLWEGLAEFSGNQKLVNYLKWSSENGLCRIAITPKYRVTGRDCSRPVL
jgi:hypothetical protein